MAFWNRVRGQTQNARPDFNQALPSSQRRLANATSHLVWLALLAAGCGSGGGAAAPDGGTGGGVGTGTGGSAAAAAGGAAGGPASDAAADRAEDAAADQARDASADGAPADTSGLATVIAVVVENIAYVSTPSQYSEVHGAFTDTPAIFSDEITLCAQDSATFATVGGCDIIKCATEGPDIVGIAYAGLVPLLIDRGPLTVTSDGVTATATYRDDYIWVNHDQNTPAPATPTWQAGSTVRAMGGGQSNLPAFDRSVTFPPHVAPAGALLTSGVISIPVASPFLVNWSAAAGGPADMATIQLLGMGTSVVGATTPWVAATCRAPLAGGSFTLAPALLAQFAVGPNALLTVSSDTRLSFIAGGLPASLVARDIVEATVAFTR